MLTLSFVGHRHWLEATVLARVNDTSPIHNKKQHQNHPSFLTCHARMMLQHVQSKIVNPHRQHPHPNFIARSANQNLAVSTLHTPLSILTQNRALSPL